MHEHILKKAFDKHFEAPLEAWKGLSDLCEEVGFKKNERIKEADEIAKFGYVYLYGKKTIMFVQICF